MSGAGFVQQHTPAARIWGRQALKVRPRDDEEAGIRRPLVWKFITGFVAATLAASGCLAADLTKLEMRWLKGVWPVVAFAHTAKFPLDIIVQPQPTPDAAPLALGFIDGRCKLVLSMRGNAEAQATLDRIEPELLDAALELMAAHELGHCQRYLDGSWFGLPAGFAASEPAGLSADLRRSYGHMAAVRREEGYADLVGLAWVRQHHPEKFGRLHAWLIAERSRDLIPGSHHDTLAWIQIAGDGDALLRPSIFAGAATLWGTGLGAAGR